MGLIKEVALSASSITSVGFHRSVARKSEAGEMLDAGILRFDNANNRLNAVVLPHLFSGDVKARIGHILIASKL